MDILESKISMAIHKECNGPEGSEIPEVIDMCSIIGYIWAQEYLLNKILPQDIEEAPEMPNEELLRNWITEQHRRAILTKITMTRQLLGACIYPGEKERHARKNNGVFASDLTTVLEETRPYIATKAMVERCEVLDIDFGCGVLVMHLINRYLMAALKLPWATHNVFIDVEFMDKKKHESVKHRTQPWIILLGSTWYVIHRQRAWKTLDPYRAALLWFSRLKESEDQKFYMGWDTWDLSVLDFPPKV
jgi:hypothetical protein